MAAPWTLGPWRWEERRGEDGRHLTTLLVTDAPNPPHRDPVILAVREDWIRTPNGREQARALILAAPELLAALRSIEEWTQARDGSAESDAAALEQIRAIAAAAIVKGGRS